MKRHERRQADRKAAAELAQRRFLEAPQRPVVDEPALILLMPTRGRPTVETLKAVMHLDGIKAVILTVARKGIVDARNELAAEAQKIPGQAPFIPRRGWYALWCDDDAFWRPGTVTRLLNDLQQPGVDVVAGWFGGRSERANPKAFREDGSWPVPGKDCALGDVVEVAKVGFHFVAHRLAILNALGRDPFTLEGTGERGEDLAFCARVREAGCRIWADTGAPVAHVDDDGDGKRRENGLAYLPGEDALRVIGTQLAKAETYRDYGGLEGS